MNARRAAFLGRLEVNGAAQRATCLGALVVSSPRGAGACYRVMIVVRASFVTYTYRRVFHAVQYCFRAFLRFVGVRETHVLIGR